MIWAVAIALLGSAALIWSFFIVWKFVEPRIGRDFPEWAWQHGTAGMQRYAAQVLVARIETGMTFQQILDVLGPGCSDWPTIKQRKLRSEDTVSFNLRADYNNGIDVGFRNGHVISAFYYD